MIEAIIFDAEGVVIDTHPLWVKGDMEFMQKNSSRTNLEQLYQSEIVSKIVGNSILDGTKIFKKILDIPGELEELVKERVEIMERLFKTEIKFIDGFEQFFNKNVKNSYKTAIGTSIKKEFFELVEQRLLMRQFFGDNIYHIYDIRGISKPNPDIFLYAAHQIGASPKECLVIEDAPNGIEAAKRAGMKCIALTTTFKGDKLTGADLIVDHYSKINLSTI
ncbi:MAG: HAD family phosphatase [Candidatus Doudnabacteria bacterium]|nr:HAD family phosphatase [Candidatus Doudnabacteria bacterium]